MQSPRTSIDLFSDGRHYKELAESPIVSPDRVVIFPVASIIAWCRQVRGNQAPGIDNSGTFQIRKPTCARCKQPGKEGCALRDHTRVGLSVAVVISRCDQIRA